LAAIVILAASRLLTSGSSGSSPSWFKVGVQSEMPSGGRLYICEGGTAKLQADIRSVSITSEVNPGYGGSNWPAACPSNRMAFPHGGDVITGEGTLKMSAADGSTSQYYGAFMYTTNPNVQVLQFSNIGEQWVIDNSTPITMST
jgi:hypothetical protein